MTQAQLITLINRILARTNTPTGRTTDGARVIRSNSWKALPDHLHREINDAVERMQRDTAKKVWGETFVSLTDARKRAVDIMPHVVYNLVSSGGDAKRTLDNYRGAFGASFGLGGISNSVTQTGVPGQDPTMASGATANIWLSPQEANAVYSQKGIPEIIIRKKSQSILLNMPRIRNPRLSARQLRTVQEDSIRTDFDQAIADAVRDSLVYGGALVFPMYMNDTPITVGMHVGDLKKYGVIKKGAISRYVTLDRWQVVHTPGYNPVAEDFRNPKHFYIPYMGADVHISRCARVVTGAQAGYWGHVMTYGWGLADPVGWIDAVYRLYSVLQTIPTMINQMSIIARTLNVDGVLASEGAAVLDELVRAETARQREMSPHSLINIDVLGELQSIKRDFSEVPQLVRLLRQDVGGRAGIPEELIWSSERGAFASDSTDSAYEKQSENTRYLHRDVARQLRNVAMLQIVNALGPTNEVIAALPYTTLEFDNPRVTNAKDKAEIWESAAKGFFDTVAGGIDPSMAMQIAQQSADDEFQLPPDLLEKLETKQKTKEAREEEKHNLEMELLQAQIEATKQGPASPAGPGGPAKPEKSADKKRGHSYEDRLTQKEHEKVGANRGQVRAGSAGRKIEHAGKRARGA